MSLCQLLLLKSSTARSLPDRFMARSQRVVAPVSTNVPPTEAKTPGMNRLPCNPARWGLALAALCAGLTVDSTEAATQALPTGSHATNAIQAILSVEIPQSIFTIPANPKEGRNPFFPQARIEAPVNKTPKENSTDTTGIVLNGITSPPKRTAMINGYTFEQGEEHEVRRPDGSKVMIKCEDIRADSAIISLGGLRKELRLRMGL